MIGIIPSSSKTYEVYGDLNDKTPIEGKLYYDPKTNILYYYSTIETRPNPKTGYFPIWDGKSTHTSSFAKIKHISDITKTDIASLSASINADVAHNIMISQKKAMSTGALKPAIADGDNMFTQCIKGSISALNISMIDLLEMGVPKYQESAIQNYYAGLSKITFMRIDRWYIWLDILKLTYDITVYKDGKQLIYYNYLTNELDTGIVKYNNIARSKMDPLKKIVKILMVMENISKADLKSDEVDAYTINNMMTTINGAKPLSAQIFSRFLRMTGMDYTVNMYHEGDLIFTYQDV